jgi:hypothetical protein
MRNFITNSEIEFLKCVKEMMNDETKALARFIRYVIPIAGKLGADRCHIDYDHDDDQKVVTIDMQGQIKEVMEEYLFKGYTSAEEFNCQKCLKNGDKKLHTIITASTDDFSDINKLIDNSFNCQFSNCQVCKQSVRKKIKLNDLVFIHGRQKSTSLDRIQREFSHNDSKFDLKFVTNYSLDYSENIGDSPTAHLTTFCRTPQGKIWFLNDNKKEKLIDNGLEQRVIPIILCFKRRTADLSQRFWQEENNFDLRSSLFVIFKILFICIMYIVDVPV